MAFELAGGFLQVLEDLALGVDRVDRAVEERGLQRPEGQVVLVVAAQPQLRGVVHPDLEHLRLVVPVVGVGELDDLDVVHRHVVDPQHQLDAGVLLDPPPVVLDRVQAPGQADLLPLQVAHREDVVPGPDQHRAALVDLGRSQQLGAADVGVDVDGRVQAAEADQVVEVVDVVRVPVVLVPRAEVGVLHAELLELLTAPAELLVDVVRRDHRAVGEEHLVPVQRDRRGSLLGCVGRGHRALPPTRMPTALAGLLPPASRDPGRPRLTRAG